jgi:hypothetical protein
MRSTHQALVVVATVILTVACSHKNDEGPEVPSS